NLQTSNYKELLDVAAKVKGGVLLLAEELAMDDDSPLSRVVIALLQAEELTAELRVLANKARATRRIAKRDEK
ncbi:MAG: hypothetical protein KGR26_01910, partial [Cyanobacteria bacterium REEB65]|nr:hypothetical protein [Cyanobacteria bacterium REEB65]